MDEDLPTREDYESVDRATEELRRRGWRIFGINAAVDAWSDFVTSVEEGYGMNLDEYTNDVHVRAWPEQARQFLTTRVARSMDDQLAPLDARFREATQPTVRPLSGNDGEWWKNRLPIRLVGELAADVEWLRLRDK